MVDNDGHRPRRIELVAKGTRANTKTPMKITSVSFPDDLHDAIRTFATKEQRSFSNAACILIRRGLKSSDHL